MLNPLNHSTFYPYGAVMVHVENLVTVQNTPATIDVEVLKSAAAVAAAKKGTTEQYSQPAGEKRGFIDDAIDAIGINTSNEDNKLSNESKSQSMNQLPQATLDAISKADAARQMASIVSFMQHHVHHQMQHAQSYLIQEHVANSNSTDEHLKRGAGTLRIPPPPASQAGGKQTYELVLEACISEHMPLEWKIAKFVPHKVKTSFEVFFNK